MYTNEGSFISINFHLYVETLPKLIFNVYPSCLYNCIFALYTYSNIIFLSSDNKQAEEDVHVLSTSSPVLCVQILFLRNVSIQSTDVFCA